ncbi:MAG: DUF1080 domain-containing protein, partial [bacterium]
MIKIVCLIAIACLMLSCSNTKKENWISLFNGKDISNWTVKIHHHDVGDNYGNTFRVEDSMIKIRYDQYDEFNDRFGHLYYNTPYSHFKLKFDYRFTGIWRKDAPEYTELNSGVMYHSQDPRTMLKEQDWPISVEFQLLAGLERNTARVEGRGTRDKGNSQLDSLPRPTGNMCSPGTDVVFEGKIDPRHCINSSSNTYYGNQWVHAELIVLGDSLVTHIINGDTVLQYSKPQIGGGVANRYDPKIKIDGKLLKEG